MRYSKEPLLKYPVWRICQGACGPPEVVAFWDGANPAYAASIYLCWMVQYPDDLKSCGLGPVRAEKKESSMLNVTESSRVPLHTKDDVRMAKDSTRYA